MCECKCKGKRTVAYFMGLRGARTKMRRRGRKELSDVSRGKSQVSSKDDSSKDGGVKSNDPIALGRRLHQRADQMVPVVIVGGLHCNSVVGHHTVTRRMARIDSNLGTFASPCAIG